MAATHTVRSRNVLRAVPSRMRIDDDVSVARNANLPLTQVKRAPVEAERSRADRPRDSHRAPIFRVARQA
ncbi:hypothetical protein DM992_35805 [Burkholderia sp. JP2-270]|nr:hypothetical protein DM992_35805 [Burkholderia sp. JP2-270]